MNEPIYTKQHMEVMRDEWKKEIDQLKETLYAIMQISINDMDHDMMRVFKLCDKALEAAK